MSTGGTAKLLADQGLPVTEVAELTGFSRNAGRPRQDPAPQSPRRSCWPGAMCPSTWRRSRRTSIDTIDLLVVNLYPFEATVAKPGCTLEDAIENIDIGGPAMVRSCRQELERRGAC